MPGLGLPPVLPVPTRQREQHQYPLKTLLLKVSMMEQSLEQAYSMQSAAGAALGGEYEGAGSDFRSAMHTYLKNMSFLLALGSCRAA